MMNDVYWAEWNVAERNLEDMKRLDPAAAVPDPVPVPVPVLLSRADATASWEFSPLVAAAARGDVDWVKELLAEGADVNEFSSGMEFSPLIVAAQKGHTEVVHTLLGTGKCDLSKKHMEYINAIDSALHGYCDLAGFEAEFTPQIQAMIIRAYMETADSTADCINTETLLRPLIVAAQKGHDEIVRILLMTGVCDLSKKHMGVSAIDSALDGYDAAEFTPQIRAMIIRAHMETADRINLDTLLRIEAAGAVLPEFIKAFRSGGVRPKAYPKKLPGMLLDLSDPPAAKMPSIICAARHAARCIAAEKDAAAAAAAIAAGKALKMKKTSGPSAVPARLSTAVCAAAEPVDRFADEDCDERPKRIEVYNPSLDDKYGKMSRRFNFK